MLAIVFLLLTGDWHLPPLVAGRPVTFQVDGKSQDQLLRYNALWDVSVDVKAWSEDSLGLLLEVYGSDGVLRTRDAEREGNVQVGVTIDLKADETLRVRVGCVDSDVEGRVEVMVEETPDLTSWRQAQNPFSPPAPTSELQLAINRAGELLASAEQAEANQKGEAARALCRQAASILEAAPGCDDDERVAEIRLKLAGIAHRLEGPAAEAVLRRKVLSLRERMLPAGDGRLHVIRVATSVAMQDAGDVQGALKLKILDLAWLEKTSRDERELEHMRHNLAVTLIDLGDFHGARLILEQLLKVQVSTAGADSHDAIVTQTALAEVARRSGDCLKAHQLEAQLLAHYEHVGSKEVELWRDLRLNLAMTKGQLGDVAGERTLAEEVVASCEHNLAADHPTLLRALGIVAEAMLGMGDLVQARAIKDRILDAAESRVPINPREVREARRGLAIVLGQLGETDRARELMERVVDAVSHELGKEHIAVQSERLNLAAILHVAGDVEKAGEIEKDALRILDQQLDSRQPRLIAARFNYSVTLCKQRDLAHARPLQEQVILDGVDVLTKPLYLTVLGEHAWTLAQLHDDQAMARTLDQLLTRSRDWLLLARVWSSRERQEGAQVLNKMVSTLLQLSELDPDPDRLRRPIFTLLQMMRAAAASTTPIAERVDEETASLKAQVEELNEAVAGLVSREISGRPEPREDAAAVSELVRRRDSAEARCRARLASAADPGAVSIEQLATPLGSEDCLVDYRIYERFELGPKREIVGKRECVLAHLLRHDGSLLRIELGPVSDVLAAVTRWRDAVARVVDRGSAQETSAKRSARSIDSIEPAADARAAGEALRTLVLDPLIKSSPGIVRWFVCLDGPLHLVPLDALPLGDGVVGDDYEINVESSFDAQRVARASLSAAPTLLAMGAIAYNEQSTFLTTDFLGSAPPVAMRSGGGTLRCGRSATPPRAS
jgi:tetratricopeptide (TPR) repeat protein